MKNVFLIIVLLLLPCNAFTYTMDDCIGCHGEGSKESRLHISISAFKDSIHGGEINCMDCHEGAISDEHELKNMPVAVDCGQCHEKDNQHGLSGKSKDRPKCYSCHGKHGILGKDNPSSRIHPEQLKYTCRGCHPAESGGAGYFSWFPSLQIKSHKKQDYSQNYDRSNCIGCHQGQTAHGETEPLDAQNCHTCHMAMKKRAAVMGYIHPKAELHHQPVTFFAAVLYQAFMLLTLWSLFRLISSRISGKSSKRRR